MKNYYVYILRSKKDGNLYKGFTKNLRKRLEQHNKGKVKSTKGRVPFILFYKECFSKKEDAIIREKYLKTIEGGKELAKILVKV